MIERVRQRQLLKEQRQNERVLRCRRAAQASRERRAKEEQEQREERLVEEGTASEEQIQLVMQRRARARARSQALVAHEAEVKRRVALTRYLSLLPSGVGMRMLTFYLKESEIGVWGTVLYLAWTEILKLGFIRYAPSKCVLLEGPVWM